MTDSDSDVILIKKYVQEGQDLGLYNFVILLDTNREKTIFDCISALDEFSDCSFFTVFPEITWNEHWISLCSKVKNMMPMLPSDSRNILSTASQFNQKKQPFSIYIKNDDANEASLKLSIRETMYIKCPFFFRLPKHPVSDVLPEASPFIASARLEQKYPLFLCDAYPDTVHIGKVISNQSGVIEIQNKHARWIGNSSPSVSIMDGANIVTFQRLIEKLNNVK